MGVAGLTTIAKRKDFSTRVRYRKEDQEKRPTLVIDGDGLLHFLMANSAQASTLKLWDQAWAFFGPLLGLGFPLTVFFDGVEEPRKQSTRMKRLRDKLKTFNADFLALSRGQTCRTASLGPFSRQVIFDVLHNAQKDATNPPIEIVAASGEADGPIALYARTHSVRFLKVQSTFCYNRNNRVLCWQRIVTFWCSQGSDTFLLIQSLSFPTPLAASCLKRSILPAFLASVKR